MYSDGTVKCIHNVECTEEQPPIYRNHLADNYPNPFNPSTTIEYSITNDSHVNLSIYNVSGRLIRTLVDEFKVINSYKVIWDGKDDRGNAAASGVYFYKLKIKDYVESKKLVLLR